MSRDKIWDAVSYFRKIKLEMMGDPDGCNGKKYYDSGDAKYEALEEANRHTREIVYPAKYSKGELSA